jgi:hypothetical protein
MPRLTQGISVGQQVAPLSGQQGIQDVQQAIDAEEPCEGEVVGHAHGQVLSEVECAVKPIGKEVLK